LKSFFKVIKKIYDDYDDEYRKNQDFDCGTCYICCTNRTDYPKISNLEYDFIDNFLKENNLNISIEVLKKYMTGKEIETCPCYDKEKKCLIYPVRALCCRIYGKFGFEEDIPLSESCVFYDNVVQVKDKEKYQTVKGLSEFLEIIRKYDIIKSSDKKKKFNLLISLGEEYLRQSKYDKALAIFEEAEIVNSTDPRVHFNIGNIYRQKGELKLASEKMEKSIELGSKYPYIYQNLGFIYLDIGELDKAGKQFIKAIESEPKKAMPHIGQAFLELQKGNDVLAEESCKKALEVEPQNPIALNMAKCFNINI